MADVDRFAPRLVADATEGFVEENSPVGTLVTTFTHNRKPLQLRIVDDDLVRQQIYNLLLPLLMSKRRKNWTNL